MLASMALMATASAICLVQKRAWDLARRLASCASPAVNRPLLHAVREFDA